MYNNKLKSMLEQVERLKQENKELREEIAELKVEADIVLNNWCKGDNPFSRLKNQDEQLTRAKELIDELSSSLSVVGECGEEECELLNRAEQFLRG